MKSRTLTLLAAAAASLALLGGARAQEPVLPETPPALRQFEGTLYGEVESIRRDADFAGLILKVALVETPGDGIAPAQVRGLEGERVAIAVPRGSDGRILVPDLERSLRRVGPADAVRVRVHSTERDETLYALSIELRSDSGTDTPAVLPDPPLQHGTSEGTPAAPPDVDRLTAELKAMRRELARLQQDVADLRALAEDLSRRQHAGAR